MTGAANAPRFARFFITGLALAVTVGATLGACILASTTLPGDFLFGRSPTLARAAHGYAQVFGFAALFIMGVAYHVLPRFTAAPLQTPQLARASFWLQAGGVSVLVAGLLLGPPLARPATVSGAIALLGAALSFAWVVHRTLATNAVTTPALAAYLRAGTAWLVIAAAVAIATAAGARLQPVVWELALWGFAGSWLFGMSLRILPVHMGIPAPRRRAANVLCAAYQLGVMGWIAVAFVETWTLAPITRTAAGALLAAAATVFVLQLGVLARRERSEADREHYAKFIVTAYVWLLAALLFGPAWSAAARSGVPALIADFGRHAFTLGFLTQMIVGVSMRVVPVFTGMPLWSGAWRDATYYLLNGALAARALQAVVELTGAGALWPYVALSGPLGLAAFCAFALNIAMTVRRRDDAPAAGAAGDTADRTMLRQRA